MNNYSQFSYDGLWQNTKIVETTSGSVTSTKQFIWNFDQFSSVKPNEERDAAGNFIKAFFSDGQLIGSTKYFYAVDHLGSLRLTADNGGSVQSSYSFDSFGSRTTLFASVSTDFGYTGNYFHQRSGLSLTLSRPYSANLGKWLSRDPAGERISSKTSWLDISNLAKADLSVSPILSDPISARIASLNNSTNLFAYVNNNPVSFTDPYGLGPGDAAYGIASTFAPPCGWEVVGAVIVGAALGGALAWWLGPAGIAVMAMTGARAAAFIFAGGAMGYGGMSWVKKHCCDSK